MWESLCQLPRAATTPGDIHSKWHTRSRARESLGEKRTAGRPSYPGRVMDHDRPSDRSRARIKVQPPSTALSAPGRGLTACPAACCAACCAACRAAWGRVDGIGHNKTTKQQNHIYRTPPTNQKKQENKANATRTHLREKPPGAFSLDKTRELITLRRNNHTMRNSATELQLLLSSPSSKRKHYSCFPPRHSYRPLSPYSFLPPRSATC